MMRALLISFLLLAPLAAAQVPVPITPPAPLPDLPVRPPGPDPDFGAPGLYSLTCDDATSAQCAARERATGETLTGAAIAIDPAEGAREAIAHLAGAKNDIATLRLSLDAGRTFASVALPESGVTRVSLAAAPNALLVAESTASGIVVRRMAFERALTPGAPETTLPARAPTRISAMLANGTASVAWSEGNTTHLAWAPTDGAWSVAIAPCGLASNIVAPKGIPLVACAMPESVPDQEIPEGHVALFALNATAGNLTLKGRTRAVGEPHLLVNETGNLTMGAYAYESPTRMHLRFSVSANGTRWSLPIDVGRFMHIFNPPAASAAVTGMVLVPSTQTIHVIWQETPLTVNATERRMTKALWVVSPQASWAPLWRHDLDVDEPAARAEGNALLAPIVDPQDALVVSGAREIIAFGDAGTLVHGELIEHAAPGFATHPVAQPVVREPSAGTLTALSNRPPPKFTLGFEIAAGVIVGAAAVRVLIGRIVTRTSAAPDKKEE